MLNIMIGISGSGKSTYISKNFKSNDVVISPDKLREMFSLNMSDQTKNELVWKTSYNILKELQNYNRGDIWFDATSLHWKSIKQIIENNNCRSVNLFIKLVSADIKKCKKRVKKDIRLGKKRSNVPEEIIEKQFSEFIILNSTIDNLVKYYCEEKKIIINISRI